MDDNMPHGYSFLDDDLSEVPKEKEFDHHENENVVLPRTREEVLQNLEHNGENENFLRAEAIKHGVDFDNKQDIQEPHKYPDDFTSEEQQSTGEIIK